MSDNELYHFGVKGMKWGVRRWQNKDGSRNSAGKKRYADGEAPESRRTARMKKAVDKQRKVVDSWKDSTPIKDKKGNTLLSSKDIKDICDGAQKRLEKLEYKLLISQKRDRINAGESALGRIWNKITEGDKYQAMIEVDIEKRAKVNKAWRD